MNLLLYGFVALAILGAIGGIGYEVRKSGYDACKLEWQDAEAERMKDEVGKNFLASAKLEKGNADAKVVYRTITRDVDKVVDRVEYRDVCLDPDGLRLANDALRGARAALGEPDGRVPGPDAAGGGEPRSGPAQAR